MLCRFILSKEVHLDESFDEFDSDPVEALAEAQKEHRRNLLSQIDFTRYMQIHHCMTYNILLIIIFCAGCRNSLHGS